jgi:lysophospholipase L1-like esterase
MRSSLIAAPFVLDATVGGPGREQQNCIHVLTFHNSRFESTIMHSFLALGDSYTIGEGVTPGERWPVQLAVRLRGEALDIADPQIIATTGWTTDELSAAMDAASFASPYDLVTLLIGVNNQYRGRPIDEYRAQFHALLQRAIKLAGSNAGHVIVVSIPDWGVTPFAAREGCDASVVAREIDAFNAAACAEAGSVGAHWVDVTTISRAPGARAELVDDGLHPSAAQYARWTEAILPVARGVLVSA